MKKYLVVYNSTKKIECITILWWVLVQFFVQLTSRLACIFSYTLYHVFTLHHYIIKAFVSIESAIDFFYFFMLVQKSNSSSSIWKRCCRLQ
jgi:hypothetical protein